MKATEAKLLRELEQENVRIKRLSADAELDKAMLQPQARRSRRIFPSETSELGAKSQSRLCSAGSIPGVPATSLPVGGQNRNS